MDTLIVVLQGIQLVLIPIIIWLVKSYLPSYLSEKAKNLAQKEDIEQITKIVESVKHDNAATLQKLQHEQQLRMSVIDERIKKHQDAFVWWAKLVRATDEDKDILLQQARDWWNENCLYLEAEVRAEFLEFNNTIIQFHHARAGTDADLVQAQYERLYILPEKIFKAINLPKLTENELTKVMKLTAPHQR